MTAPALRVAEANARHYRRSWRGSVATAFLNPVLFLLAMGVGLGTLVNRDPAQLPEDLSYLEFLAPGLLAATAMQVAAGESTWPVMLGIVWQKTYQAVLATPLRPRDIFVGNLVWTALRLTLAGIMFAVVMVAFGASSPGRGLLAVLPAVLTGLAFAAPIAAFTASIDNDAGIAALFRFGIVPMFLFSGTFFPIAQLPDVIEPFAYVTPLWHGVALCRAAALGLATAMPWPAHAAYLGVWILIGSALAVCSFERRLVK